jgi:hypothetical protein
MVPLREDDDDQDRMDGAGMGEMDIGMVKVTNNNE